MKIMKNKTYNELMTRVKIADAFIQALASNKVYVDPVELVGDGHTISDCFFVHAGDNKPSLTFNK